jgi:hypothetical protein
VTLYFPDFNDKERQQIWQTFIDKLIKERGPSSGAPIRFRVSIDAKEFIKGREMKEVKWNGREIRNGIYIAWDKHGTSLTRPLFCSLSDSSCTCRV